jgi:hypothetical protein
VPSSHQPWTERAHCTRRSSSFPNMVHVLRQRRRDGTRTKCISVTSHPVSSDVSLSSN